MDSRLNEPIQSIQVANGRGAEKAVDEIEVQSKPTTASPSEIMGHFDPTKILNAQANVKIDVKDANFWYGTKQALYNVTIPLRERQVTALIVPSADGKSTFLRTLNRINDLIH